MVIISTRKKGSSYHLAAAARIYEVRPTEKVAEVLRYGVAVGGVPDDVLLPRNEGAGKNWAVEPRHLKEMAMARSTAPGPDAFPYRHAGASLLQPLSVHDLLRRTQDQRLLVLVHGFNTSLAIACDSFVRLARQITERAPDAYDQIIGFTWPGGASSYAYLGAKARVVPTVQHLGAWLHALSTAAQHMDVLAHSLGTHLVRETLWASGPIPVRNLFAVAPAVKLGALRRLDATAPEAPRFERAFLFYTRDDIVLKRWFPLVEWDQAVGFAGLEAVADVLPPASIVTIDCAGVIAGHLDYIEQEAFYTTLARILNGDPALMPNAAAGVRRVRLRDALGL